MSDSANGDTLYRAASAQILIPEQEPIPEQKTDGVRRAIDVKVAIIGMENVVVARIDRIGDATTVYSDSPLVEHTAKVGVKTVCEVSDPTRNETGWNSINPLRQYL